MKINQVSDVKRNGSDWIYKVCYFISITFPFLIISYDMIAIEACFNSNWKSADFSSIYLITYRNKNFHQIFFAIYELFARIQVFNFGVIKYYFDRYLWNREKTKDRKEDQVNEETRFQRRVEREIFHACVLHIPDDDQQG